MYKKNKILQFFAKKFAFFSSFSYNKARLNILLIKSCMKNIARTALYTTVATATSGLTAVNAAINPGTVTNTNIVTQGSADEVIQGYIENALTFLYLVAVVYGIWGGFNILTAGGDEDKVKTGKTVIIQALIGIVVIFLAGTIVEWLVSAIIGGGTQ